MKSLKTCLIALFMAVSSSVYATNDEPVVISVRDFTSGVVSIPESENTIGSHTDFVGAWNKGNSYPILWEKFYGWEHWNLPQKHNLPALPTWGIEIRHRAAPSGPVNDVVCDLGTDWILKEYKKRCRYPCSEIKEVSVHLKERINTTCTRSNTRFIETRKYVFRCEPHVISTINDYQLPDVGSYTALTVTKNVHLCP